MNSEIIQELLHAEDSEVYQLLGIRNWTDLLASCSKILFNNAILPYDDSSIYLIDKLHLTFKTAEALNMSIKECFYRRASLPVNDHLLLKPNYRSGQNYHCSFIIEIDNQHFGYLHMYHTKSADNCLVEADNRILYQRPMIYILAGLFHVARAVKLRFNNISVFEIDRDSTENIYQQLSFIYYQSTACNRIVHQITGKPPRYKPKTKVRMVDIPNCHGKECGTFIVGMRKSEIKIRVYDKTNEINENGARKAYITDIHHKNFDPTRSVYRVELAINSNAFARSGILGKQNIDLGSLLNRQNLPALFYMLLGDKLTFHDLTTKYYVLRNEKYKMVRLLPKPDESDIKFMDVQFNDRLPRFSHDNNINSLKWMINKYFDDEISYFSLLDYLKRRINRHDLRSSCVKDALALTITNYRNPVDSSKLARVKYIIDSLSPGYIYFRVLYAFAFCRLL
jgi:hypothetical protein